MQQIFWFQELLQQKVFVFWSRGWQLLGISHIISCILLLNLLIYLSFTFLKFISWKCMLFPDGVVIFTTLLGHSLEVFAFLTFYFFLLGHRILLRKMGRDIKNVLGVWKNKIWLLCFCLCTKTICGTMNVNCHLWICIVMLSIFLFCNLPLSVNHAARTSQIWFYLKLLSVSE